MPQTARTVDSARAYVERAKLPEPRPMLLAEAGSADEKAVTDFVFDKAKDQATVVGSDVVAFVKGLTPEQRQDVVNATMLAQLVAKNEVKNPQTLDDVLKWYDEYFNVLDNIGFVVQNRGFAQFVETGTQVEVHEAIIEVAKVALGAAPTALLLVTKTLDSLKSMNEGSPWITLFQRETRSAKTAHFQVTLAEPDKDGGLLITLLAFGMEAKATLTQVLFFKFKKNEATLRNAHGNVSINPEVLAHIRSDIATKLKDHTKSFVAGLNFKA